jgi:transposase
VEGTGAWGAGLARFLTSQSATVIEVRRGNRQHRRRHGKSDPTDAVSAARSVQSGEEHGVAKTANGAVEAIRLLQVARRSALKARSQTANQIYAVIDTAPEELRSRFHGQPVRNVVAIAARFHRGDVSTPHDAAKCALRSLARCWQSLADETVELDDHLDELTQATAPTLVALNGAGTQTASALLIAAGDNPSRLRSSASFAALCGVSPLDASSGRQQRHRLNRGGDRQANCALYIIVISRLRWDQRTKTALNPGSGHRGVQPGRTWHRHHGADTSSCAEARGVSERSRSAARTHPPTAQLPPAGQAHCRSKASDVSDTAPEPSD